jgi:hypothetical protein
VHNGLTVPLAVDVSSISRSIRARCTARARLISADKIDYATWAERIDLEAGAPVENPDVRADKL